MNDAVFDDNDIPDGSDYMQILVKRLIMLISKVIDVDGWSYNGNGDDIDDDNDRDIY